MIYLRLALNTRRNVVPLQGALMVVFLASMAGPWIYDEIMVPAQFACSAPFMRLQGDFCGRSLSGFHLITLFLGPFLGALSQFSLQGPEGNAFSAMTISDLAGTAAILALVLPAITMTVRAVRSNSRLARQLTIASWSIAALIALLIALSSSMGFPQLLWGVWLFIGLAIIALVFEGMAGVKDPPL